MEPDAGVLYTVGPKGYVATGAGRWNQPKPGPLVHAFAKRAGFEWLRDRGCEERSPAQRWLGPGAGLDGDMQRKGMERYVAPAGSTGPLREVIDYLAAFPSPSIKTVNEHLRHTDELMTFTTAAQAVLGRKRVRWYEKAVDRFDVAADVRPAMDEAIRRALAAMSEGERKPRRAKRSAARKVKKEAAAGGEAPASAPPVVSDGARQLLEDLEVDRVTTLRIAQRRYGVTRTEVEALGVRVRHAMVEAATSARVSMEVDFSLRAAEPSLARMDAAPSRCGGRPQGDRVRRWIVLAGAGVAGARGA